jgi:hypothetical protein
MRDVIRKALQNSRNRMLTDLEWEVNEVLIYVDKVAETLKLERVSIISLTLDQMRHNSNQAFSQALKHIFPKAPEMALPSKENKTTKPILHRKVPPVEISKPILLKKKTVVPGKLF